MAADFTLVRSPDGEHEALYHRGQLVRVPDGGGRYDSEDLLQVVSECVAIISVSALDVSEEYDDEVLAMDGFPQSLDEIPAPRSDTGETA